MKIEFENKFRDIYIFNAAHQFFSPVMQFLMVGVTALISAPDIIHEISQSNTVGLGGAIIVASVVYILLWIIQFVFNALYLYSRKNHSVLTTHVLELQDESLYEETKYNRSYFYWHGIVKLVQRMGLIAIYPTPHMAIIVPRRAFDSTKSRKDFYIEVQRRINQA